LVSDKNVLIPQKKKITLSFAAVSSLKIVSHGLFVRCFFVVLIDLYGAFSISFQRHFERLSVEGPNTTISERIRRQIILPAVNF